VRAERECEDLTGLTLDVERVRVGELWDRSGLRPHDVQSAIIYDHFSPYVIRQLEALGFCSPGEGARFVADGRTHIGGALPVNPHGGQLGEAYVHGMSGVAEAVRQVRGTAANQVQDVEHVVVTAGPVQATSGLILSGSRS
jgi:acetyl-CoA acetyltransferase